MRLLKQMIHKDVISLEGNIFERRAARGIILKGRQILLLYTNRYNDYSFPGGGVDVDEELISGLKRELREETGAKNIEILSECTQPRHMAAKQQSPAISFGGAKGKKEPTAY